MVLKIHLHQVPNQASQIQLYLLQATIPNKLHMLLHKLVHILEVMADQKHQEISI